MANDKWIEELAGKLNEHSSEVDPKMWQGISAQIGAGAATASGGFGFAKIASILGITFALITIAYFAIDSVSKENEPSKEKRASDSKLKKNNLETKNTKELTKENNIDVTKDLFVSDKVNPIVNSSRKEHSFTGDVTSKTELPKELVVRIAPDLPLTLKKKTDDVIVEDFITVYQNKNVKETKETTIVEEKIETPVEIESKKTAEFLKLPNIFTPNNDGVNDYFFVESKGMNNYALVVLDTRNKVIWRTNNPNDKWDGLNLGGEKAPNGSYTYFITAVDENGKGMNTHQRLEIQ